jgi:hypothetical protein
MKKFVFALAAIIALFAAAALVTTPVATGQGPKSKIRKKEKKVPNQYIVVLQDWAAQPLGENSFTPTVAADLASAHKGRIKNMGAAGGEQPC